LISLVLAKSVSLFWFEASFIKLIPLLAIIGLFLITSGIKGLKNYAREIIVITIIAIPSDSLERIINQVFHVNILTAKIATVFLWYSGIEVSNEGAILNFPDASVFVDYPCTGVGSMLILIKLSILGICVFNNQNKTTIFLITISILIGFFLGVIRASILALIVKDTVLFNYWHGNDGGSIFAMISMAIFGLIYNFIVPKLDTKI
jgi:cyanoexosortase A